MVSGRWAGARPTCASPPCARPGTPSRSACWTLAASTWCRFRKLGASEAAPPWRRPPASGLDREGSLTWHGTPDPVTPPGTLASRPVLAARVQKFLNGAYANARELMRAQGRRRVARASADRAAGAGRRRGGCDRGGSSGRRCRRYHAVSGIILYGDPHGDWRPPIQLVLAVHWTAPDRPAPPGCHLPQRLYARQRGRRRSTINLCRCSGIRG